MWLLWYLRYGLGIFVPPTRLALMAVMECGGGRSMIDDVETMLVLFIICMK